ncbi:unnamed protein product [Owenia fusiformis]|uniref:Uncharacterized protein n=1 Tax=Owenia fusiformis TaxID=6347 RepID=A0A8J1T869_OWEFU|nr:unnamed protein product [Owenia fusiformis]
MENQNATIFIFNNHPLVVNVQLADTTTPGLTAFFLVIAIFILIANTYNILVITKTPSLRENPSGVLMISLAVGDILIGLTFPLPMIYMRATGQFSPGLCVFQTISISSCCVVSIYTLGWLSFDRYIAITRPLHYDRIVTYKRIYIIITITWFVSWLVWLGPLFGIGSYIYTPDIQHCTIDPISNPIYTLFVILIVFGIVSVIIGFSYFQILKVSLYHAKRIEPVYHDIKPGEEEKKPGFKIPKAIRTLLIIVCAFYFAWTPLCAEWIVRGFAGYIGAPHIVLTIDSALCISNSFWNAIIYTLTNKAFRKSAIKLFGISKYLKEREASKIKTISSTFDGGLTPAG